MEDMLDARLQNLKLRAIVSAQWGYYGLPPSKLVSFYYALPVIGYLTGGGYYPKGRSQTMSNALVKFIESHGGQVIFNSRVEKILLKDDAALGVKVHTVEEFASRVVVSNANPFDTLGKMTDDQPIFRHT